MGSDKCQERFSKQMVNVNLEKKKFVEASLLCIIGYSHRSFPREYKRRAHVVSNREKNKLLTLNTHLLMYKTRITKLYRIIKEE